MNNVQVLWLQDKIVTIDKTPQHQIDYAHKIVNRAWQGYLPFAYLQVKQYTSYVAGQTNVRIRALKDYLVDPTINEHQVAHARDKIKELKPLSRDKIFDEPTYKLFLSNYNKLYKALQLLYAEGEIESYTLTPQGRLKVEYWTERETTYVQKIDQGATWSIKHSGFDSRKQLSRRMWALFGRVAPQETEGIPTRRKYEIVPQGMKDSKPQPKANKGSGEYNPVRLKERDADAAYFEAVDIITKERGEQYKRYQKGE